MTSPPAGGFSKIYESIRDQIVNEISAGVYPVGALLPSIREIMKRWEVSTTTARRVLNELAATGYARKEGTRGHVSTGGPQSADLQTFGRPLTPHTRAPLRGRLTIRPTYTVPANDGVHPDSRTQIAALDVRAEPPSADAAFALRLADTATPVIVRRRLFADTDGTPVQLRTSYLPSAIAEGTPLAHPEPIAGSWPTALARHTNARPQLLTSHITARHPHHDEALALALAADAALLVREDIHRDEHGTPIDFTRTVWPGDTTQLFLFADSA